MFPVFWGAGNLEEVSEVGPLQGVSTGNRITVLSSRRSKFCWAGLNIALDFLGGL